MTTDQLLAQLHTTTEHDRVDAFHAALLRSGTHYERRAA